MTTTIVGRYRISHLHCTKLCGRDEVQLQCLISRTKHPTNFKLHLSAEEEKGPRFHVLSAGLFDFWFSVSFWISGERYFVHGWDSDQEGVAGVAVLTLFKIYLRNYFYSFFENIELDIDAIDHECVFMLAVECVLDHECVFVIAIECVEEKKNLAVPDGSATCKCV